METEIEAKFLDIDPTVIREKLKTIGAVLVQSETLMRRKVFDTKDESLKKVNGWVRLRDEGNKITLSYKQLNDRTVQGTKEVTVVVSDFDKTNSFLLATDFIEKSYQETKRETWKIENSDVTIDTWPWIPSFIEIESPSENELEGVAEKLNMNWKQALHGSVETAYQNYYDVTEDEINAWKEIVFSTPPEWLEAKRRK